MSQERVLTCSECGHANAVGQTHCEACGARVPQTAKAGSVSEAPLPTTKESPTAEGAAANLGVRPTGVTVLAVLDFIGAGASVFTLLVLAADPVLSRQYGGMSMLYLLFAIGYAVLGWGMWTLREWARVLQIALSAIGLLGFPVGTIICGYIIYWLTRPHVGSAFSYKR